jgi:Trypsin-co-occurring domain 1
MSVPKSDRLPGSERVLIQVLETGSGREIGRGRAFAEQLESRLDDVRQAIIAGARAVADSLDGLPAEPGWQLGEVSASFGVMLTAEMGVLLTKTSAGATFEVTVTFQPAKE